MPGVRRTIRPLLRTATLMWLWQHRRQVPGAIRFLRDVPARWRAGHRSDVLAEARLRVRLATDPRTRDHDVLTRVHDGVAVLAAGSEASISAADIARTLRGIREVDLAAAPVVATSAASRIDRSPTSPALAKLSG